MKKLLILFLILFTILPVYSAQKVSGYRRSNGTYVNSYTRGSKGKISNVAKSYTTPKTKQYKRYSNPNSIKY